jgi:hypothetical protein
VTTLLVKLMGKWKKKKSTYEYHDTPITLLVTSFGGACAFFTVVNTIGDIVELLGQVSSVRSTSDSREQSSEQSHTPALRFSWQSV